LKSAGDERMFYLWVAPRLSVSSTNGAVFVFGDLIPQASSDPYLCYISGALGDITGTTSDNASCMGYIFGSGGYFARSYTQLGGSISALRCGPYGLAASYSGGNNYSGGSLFVTPLNPTDNALIIVPVFGFEQVTNRCLRGQFPGFYHTPGSLVNSVLVHLDIYSNLDSMPGKTLLGFRVSAAAAGAGVNNSGYAFVDLIGPWR
jgi:hypothetical protein